MSTLSEATPNLPVSDTGHVLNDSERQPCEIWTRVMGYHRPVSSFNAGKQAEFAERVNYDFEEAPCSD